MAGQDLLRRKSIASWAASKLLSPVPPVVRLSSVIGKGAPGDCVVCDKMSGSEVTSTRKRRKSLRLTSFVLVQMVAAGELWLKRLICRCGEGRRKESLGTG